MIFGGLVSTGSGRMATGVGLRLLPTASSRIALDSFLCPNAANPYILIIANGPLYFIMPDRVGHRRLVAVCLIVLSALILIPSHYVSPVRASGSQPLSFCDVSDYKSISQLSVGELSIKPICNHPTSYYEFCTLLL